jgi:hypothetical protein
MRQNRIRFLYYFAAENGYQVSSEPSSRRRWSRTKKLLTYLVALLFGLGLAARPLARGTWFYQSYWGGAVFAPFLLLFAALIAWIAVRDWNRK